MRHVVRPGVTTSPSHSVNGVFGRHTCMAHVSAGMSQYLISEGEQLPSYAACQ